MILVVLGVAGITGVIPGGIFGTASDTPNEALVREPIRLRPEPSRCALCGTVESIRALELRVVPEDADSAGASGATAARPIGREDESPTTLETVTQAVTGGETDTNLPRRFAYRITVRMDDGSYRTISQSSRPALAVGDKVRVVEGRLVRA